MSKIVTDYQNELLNEARKENVPITIYLNSGYQLKGVIKAYDNYVLMLESDGKQQMVYKHAISTIVPAKNVKLNYNKCQESSINNE